MFGENGEYNNFVPTNIFKKDRYGNDVYFQWGKFGNGYIIDNSEKKARLIELEGYKYFFVSYKAPIFFPIIIFSLIIGGGISFLIDYKGEPKDIISITILVIYIITISIYFYKISKTLRGCEKISKEEKKWIFEMSNNTLDDE